VPGTDPFSAPASPLPQPFPSPQVRQILEEARTAGFLGPGPLDTHLRHAQGFVALCRHLWPDGPTPPLLLDLGSGGGLPGLVVAAHWPEAALVLLDAQGRRTAFLSNAVRRLGFGSRVSVRQDRAEAAGRDPDLRGYFDGVLARSFGPPAVVAECAAPLLRPGGWLAVSEPPADSPVGPPDGPADPAGPTRWPADPLRQLGLVPDGLVHEEFGYQLLRQADPCPDRFPRRNGVPAKRPLF
jgi:16S rRNA (guanine527-N7)-methyltransferase